MRKRPPCPGNPEDYTWVNYKEGACWRRKRGSVQPANLNAGYDQTKIVSPAAKKVRDAHAPYLDGINAGRLQIRIATAFRKSVREKDCLQLGYLKGMEVQKEHALGGMLACNYRIHITKKNVRIEIPIFRGSVRALNRLVSDYYFEAVLLYGDMNKEKRLETESVVSPLYPFYGSEKTACVIELSSPGDEDWCLFLKLSCHEGNELAAHTKHYRMKAVEASLRGQ